jgi:hypothetical protein
MSGKLNVTTEVTSTSTYRRAPYRGYLVQEPGKRPHVAIERPSTNGGADKLFSAHLMPEELEIIASIITGMQRELEGEPEAKEG